MYPVMLETTHHHWIHTVHPYISHGAVNDNSATVLYLGSKPRNIETRLWVLLDKASNMKSSSHNIGSQLFHDVVGKTVDIHGIVKQE
jgi:hypothetical protein